MLEKPKHATTDNLLYQAVLQRVLQSSNCHHRVNTSSTFIEVTFSIETERFFFDKLHVTLPDKLLQRSNQLLNIDAKDSK